MAGALPAGAVQALARHVGALCPARAAPSPACQPSHGLTTHPSGWARLPRTVLGAWGCSGGVGVVHGL